MCSAKHTFQEEVSTMSLVELFCDVDDFCLAFEQWTASQELGQPGSQPGPKPHLCASEIMTIIIYFHMSHYRDFKHYYTEHVLQHLRSEFPGLVSYTRFVELMPLALCPSVSTCSLASAE
jgi:hypothetical protein